MMCIPKSSDGLDSGHLSCGMLTHGYNSIKIPCAYIVYLPKQNVGMCQPLFDLV